MAVVTELRSHLIGGQIQEVRQPGPMDIVLGVRNRNHSYLLTLSADARFARVHLTQSRRPYPAMPPNFCMTLRKHIEDRWIRDITQRGFDRVMAIDMGGRAPEDGGGIVTLISELMGKHSNLILVNELGTILDSAKRITNRVNRIRETLPGIMYLPPPEQPDRIDPFGPGAVENVIRELPGSHNWDDAAISAGIQQIFAGISPLLARELAARAGTGGIGNDNAAAGFRLAWSQVFGALGAGLLSPVLVRDVQGRPIGAYPVPLITVSPARQTSIRAADMGPASNGAALNSGLDVAYTCLISRAQLDAVIGEMRGKIEREINRVQRRLSAVERALQEAGRAEEYKQSGELILANLWRMRPGESSVEVEDYYQAMTTRRTVLLNPKHSPQENADNYFQRYRKARDGQEKERARGLQAAEHLSRLRAALAELERLGTVGAVRSLRDELLRNRLLRASDDSPESEGATHGRHIEPEFAGHKIRRFRTLEGFEILVGETATANDYLTTRIAAPNDVWLHVRAARSAHVVIRTHGQPEAVPRSVLERAATLCAQHSANKHSSLVSVDYTLRKYVRKPRGSAPGGADYQRESTIDVQPT